MQISLQNLKDVKVKSSTHEEVLKSFNGNCDRFEVNTFLRIAHFMAQVCHECGGFSIKIENLNYKNPYRLMEVWPKRFPSLEVANQYINNPQKLGNYVYSNRLGNGGPETNDGYKFRGRGALQTTGKDWYRFVSKKLFDDERLIDNPDILSEIEIGLEAAFVEWNEGKCNRLADLDDVKSVTKKINGALTGLEGRTDWLVNWKHTLGD